MEEKGGLGKEKDGSVPNEYSNDGSVMKEYSYEAHQRSPVNLVRETAAIYGVNLGRNASTNALRMLVDGGLATSALRQISAWLGADFGPRFILRVVPKATLARRKDKLSLDESQKTNRIASVIALAEHVWNGDAESARMFLTSKHPLLDGDTPIERALSEIGAQQVQELLWAIEYGLPV